MTQPFLPNEADAFNANQAEPDSVDFEILLLGYQRTGVISGCAVTESSPAAQTVDVAVGEVVETGEQISVSAQINQAVSAADGSNPRIDLISVNSSGTVVVTAGTAAAQPVMPAVPATSIPLATLYVAASDNTHADNQINDKRVIVIADDGNALSVTVGSGGDFANLNDAVDEPGVTAISILTGFVMAEQIIVHQKDLSHIRITSVDATVSITRSSLAVVTLGDTPASTFPAFAAIQNAALPLIDCLFDMDTSGTATGRHGVFVSESSRAVIARNAGVQNAGDRGLYLVNSIVYARETVWDGAVIGARVGNASLAVLRDASLINCTTYGLWVAGGSSVAAQDGFVSGAGDTGVLVENGSTALLDRIDASGSSGEGIEVLDGSEVSMQSANCSGATGRALNVISSRVDADSANLSSAGGRALNATKGSYVNANNVNGASAGDSNAVGCFSGSTVNVKNATLSSAGSDEISIGTGGVVISDSPATANAPLNVLTQKGVVYQNDSVGLANTPEGAETAPVGALFHRSNGALGTTLYYKASGTGNTGWRPIGTGAIEEAGAVTLDWEDAVVNMDSAGGTRIVTLPDNAAFDGKSYLIRRDGSNTVTIDRAGTDTFDDADIQKTLDSDSAAIGIFSIGDGEWKIVATEGTVGGS